MATVELTKENLESTIQDSEILLIDFWAGWCGPCKAFGPVFQKVSDAHPDVVFAKCDTEAQPEIAAAFSVQSIPTLVVFRDHVMLYREPGSLPEDKLEEIVTKTISLDMDEVRAAIAEAEAEEEGGD